MILKWLKHKWWDFKDWRRSTIFGCKIVIEGSISTEEMQYLHDKRGSIFFNYLSGETAK